MHKHNPRRKINVVYPEAKLRETPVAAKNPEHPDRPHVDHEPP